MRHGVEHEVCAVLAREALGVLGDLQLLRLHRVDARLLLEDEPLPRLWAQRTA